MNKSYEVVRVVKIYAPTDYPQFSRHEFTAFVRNEFVNLMQSLPKDAEYVALQDVSPTGVRVQFHFINGVAAVREINSYDIKSDGTVVAFHAEYLREVVATAKEEAPPAVIPATTSPDMTPDEIAAEKALETVRYE